MPGEHYRYIIPINIIPIKERVVGTFVRAAFVTRDLNEIFLYDLYHCDEAKAWWIILSGAAFWISSECQTHGPHLEITEVDMYI